MEKKTILIVDDSPENLTVLYKNLRDDYKVVGAGSGAEALRLAAANKPDLILLDVMMPEMSGFEVCSILKGQDSLKEIPVLFITALTEEADEVTGFALGAVDYITKPFKPAILKRRIKTHLEIVQTEKERQLLEQQYQQTQKLESLGVLAGGIAHDFNNILTIIMGYCELMKMDPHNVIEKADHIQKAAGRAAELCRQMLAYAGKAQITQVRVNMVSLVDEMLAMLKTTIQKNVEIRVDFAADIPIFHGDTSQLSQVVMNLIINASEAIGDMPGRIKVSLARCEIKEEQTVKDHIGRVIPAGRYVCLEVSDDGCGMDEETMNRLFEPFFTTKFAGRGLGMSATLGIIRSHKGALQCFSQPGHGTTFKVYLPLLIDEISEPAPIASIAPAQWQGSGVVLLVEDEEQIAYLAKAMLQQLGFTVIAAEHGKEALALYHEHASDIVLVLTDIGMPVMDGYVLFRELKNINPQLPIVISSGFGDTVVTMRIPQEEIAGLISKPYRFNRLRDVLKEVTQFRASR